MDKNKTLYISDLDGTLLDRNSEVSVYSKSALNGLISQGVHFTIATGRTTDAAIVIMSDIGLNVPIITFNGVVIYNVRNKSFEKVYRLDSDAVKNAVSILKLFSVSWLMYELCDNELIAYYDSLRHKPINDFVEDRKARYNSTFSHVEDLRDVFTDHIVYFTLIDTYERIKPVYDALKVLPNINMAMVDDTSINGLWWLEIYSAEASKEKAIMYIREKYGYSEVIGFGDNYNDLPMFKACDISVAVNNALDGIKTAADYICEAHDDDGVVKWITGQSQNNALA